MAVADQSLSAVTLNYADRRVWSSSAGSGGSQQEIISTDLGDFSQTAFSSKPGSGNGSATQYSTIAVVNDVLTISVSGSITDSYDSFTDHTLVTEGTIQFTVDVDSIYTIDFSAESTGVLYGFMRLGGMFNPYAAIGNNGSLQKTGILPAGTVGFSWNLGNSGNGNYSGTLRVSPVPEPSGLILNLLAGLAGLGRRKRATAH